MNCEKCGANLPENTTLCPICGTENAPAPVVPDAVAETARNALEEAAKAIEEPVDIVPGTVDEAAQDALHQAAQAIEEPEAEPVTCNEEDPAWEEPAQPQGRVNIIAPIYTRPPEDILSPEELKAASKSGEVPSPLDYFLMQLVTGLPLIGLIVSIVWAADSSGPAHRKNYALGNLLYRLIVLIVKLLLLAITLSVLNLIVSRLALTSPYMGGFNGFNGFFY